MSDAWIGTVDRPLEPLWRGVLVYRGLTLVSAIAVALYRLGAEELARRVGGGLPLVAGRATPLADL